ncbi:hypothetical protein E4U12_005759 [Claviceps purpurea]|nr:hypothetical protein E4U12_005759 [Claviceps purpurea]
MAFPTLYPHGTGDRVEARLRSVSFKDYILRALKLSDGRAARHPKFRYVLYKINYLEKDQREDVTVEKLREMFNQNSDGAQTFQKSITRYAGNKPVGHSLILAVKAKGAAAMVRGLECPSLFMTSSAAELHWESLAKLMLDYEA